MSKGEPRMDVFNRYAPFIQDTIYVLDKDDPRAAYQTSLVQWG